MHTLRTFGRLAIALVLVLSMVGAAFVVTAPAARADHDTIAWSAPVTVASSTGFAYYNSWVVADGHGYIYVFYTTTNTGTFTTNINVTKYAAVGAGGLPQKLFDKQVNVVANVVSGSYPIAATIDSSGHLYVAWTHIASPTYTQVYVSASSDGGVTWAPGQPASNPSSPTNSYWPNIVATPDGTVYVSWIQSVVGKYSVSVAKSTNDGVTFSSPTNATSGAYVRSSSMVADAGGRIYVLDSIQPTPTSTYMVNASWSDDGVTWSSPVTISGTSSYPIFPQAVVDASGAVHAAWYEIASGDYVISYSQSRNRGASWSGPMAISTPFGGGYIGYLASEGDTVMYVWGDFGVSGFGYLISADQGTTWYPGSSVNTGATSLATVAADQNGTFWAASLDASNHLTLWPWYGPPSRPMVDSVVASGSSLTITWTPPPEQNVVDYRIWRSADGTNYQAIALVSAGTTSYTDAGLQNGTYYYMVTAVNVYGTSSHASFAMSGTVGVTVAQLENEIANLQSQLTSANEDLGAIQTQLDAVKSQLSSVQGNTTALQNQIKQLQDQLNTLQGQQATQTMSYANLAFEIIVVVLLVVLLLNQMRKPKNPRIMMAQPAQVEPKKPEDEL